MNEDDRKAKSQHIQQAMLDRYGDGAAADCPCPGACRLHGRCAACVAWHRDHARWPLPYCLREGPGVTCRRGDDLRHAD